jgi:hypothetical protein
VVFGKGGLHAKFIRALLSSDSFFVESEMGRYKAARKVLELRRRAREDISAGDLGASPSSIPIGEGEDEDDEEWEDEEEMEKVFTDGIYYTHMVSPFGDTWSIRVMY